MKISLLITASLIGFGLATAQAENLRVERLTWAGVKISSAQATVFIDAVGTDLWNGKAPQGLVPVSADTRLRYALLTHLHNDHFDPATLIEVLGEKGSVICTEEMASYLASRGLRVISTKLWEPQLRGGFVFTAVPAQDGFGDNQVSWLIRHEQIRILHAGDTLWHGRLRAIGAQFGPLDIAFLPINGARMPSQSPIQTAAVMSPQQAVDAAFELGARSVVPIHYGLNNPPHYVEVDQPLESFQALAAEQSLQVQALLPGELYVWPEQGTKAD